MKKQVVAIFAVLMSISLFAGLFGIITKGDVRDAFIRQTYLHKVAPGWRFVPNSVIVEKTETKNVWKVQWRDEYDFPGNELAKAQVFSSITEGLYYAEESKKYACSLRELSTKILEMKMGDGFKVYGN